MFLKHIPFLKFKPIKMNRKIITLTILIGFSFLSLRGKELKHVEPPFWWVGMKNQSLQLLIHGDDIGRSNPSIEYPGIGIDSVIRPSNSNYLFLYLTVYPDVMAGTFSIQFMEDTKKIATYEYELKERMDGSANRKGFNSSDVIYLLMPDRFANGDTLNDSMDTMHEKADRSRQGGRHGGDIKGIIDHLDYLHETGFTAIWSTPMLEDNMETYSYHTYAITNYYSIDPRYGTNQDYKKLSDELHKRDMKLIMDMVTNHCGINHWWMEDLPFNDWVHQFPEFTRSNYRISTTYDPYVSKIDSKLNFEGWFDYTMPDLNQDNTHLLKYLMQNAIWWVEFANLDGIRVDTYPYNNLWSTAQWTKSIMEEYPNLNIVGECWLHSSQEIAYWQTGNSNFDGYDSYLPSVMDFTLHDAFSTAFVEPGGWSTGLSRFYEHLARDWVFPNVDNLVIFAENHDTQRFNTIIKNDLNKYKMAYTLLFTLRGIPQYYYGSEILMTGDKGKGDGDIRRDFPGGWPGDERNAFTKEGRSDDEDTAYEFIKKILNWRKNNPVVHNGKTLHFIPQDNCYVYFRYNDDKTIMIILNNNDKTRELDGTRFDEVLNGFSKGYDILSDKEITNLKMISIPEKVSMIIELKP